MMHIYVFLLHSLPVLVLSSNTPGAASICVYFICVTIESNMLCFVCVWIF